MLTPVHAKITVPTMSASPEQLLHHLNIGIGVELDALAARYGFGRRLTDCEPDLEFRERIRPWVVHEIVAQSGIGAERAPRRALTAMGEMYGIRRKWWEWNGRYRRRVMTVISGVRPQVDVPMLTRLQTSDGRQVWSFPIPKWWLKLFG